VIGAAPLHAQLQDLNEQRREGRPFPIASAFHSDAIVMNRNSGDRKRELLDAWRLAVSIIGEEVQGPAAQQVRTSDITIIL